MSDWSRILRRAGRIASAAISSAASSRSRAPGSTSPGRAPRRPAPAASASWPTPAPTPAWDSADPLAAPGARRIETPHAAPYPGDFTGTIHAVYQPSLDGDADPGEIVWTWVPYEEDHSRGKDRPVLVVGHDGPWLLGLMLSSKDHSRDAADEARWGRRWVDIGSGPWDPQGRESEIRLDRVLRLDPGGVRREGAIVDRATFDRVVASIG